MDDILSIEEQLTLEERCIKQTVDDFRRDIMPSIPQAFDDAVFPVELIKKMADLGFLGMMLPSVYGGAEASAIGYGLVCEGLEAADSAIRSFVSVQSSLCMYPIYRYGSEDLKQRYLPLMSKGECIGCFGLTEPNAGSDPAAMSSRAKKVKGGYRLSGEKLWITNAMLAHLAIVWAKTEDGSIRGFLIPTNSEGLSRYDIHQKYSLRASNTGGLQLTDVFVPEDHCLETKGLSSALDCLNQARYGIAWGVMGAATTCFDIVQEYIQTRTVFNKPLAAFQLIQAELAAMYTELIKAKMLNFRVGQLKDSGLETPVMISLIKRNACHEALKIARMCRNLLGANGITLDYHVIRHMLNLESVLTYEGSENIHTLVIGKHLTGLNAFT